MFGQKGEICLFLAALFVGKDLWEEEEIISFLKIPELA